MPDYIALETGGGSRITLEDGSGFVLLEFQTPIPTVPIISNISGDVGIKVPWYPHRS